MMDHQYLNNQVLSECERTLSHIVSFYVMSYMQLYIYGILKLMLERERESERDKEHKNKKGRILNTESNIQWI